MPLITGRARECARVSIDHEACTGCGLCVSVCKGAPLSLEQGRVQVDQSKVFGCIGCGHCMAICPQGCITVNGRDLTPGDLLDLPPRPERASFEQLHNLLLARRSVRAFAEREVEEELLEKILAAVSTAPMGLPPSDVEILVFRGRDKVQEFAADMVECMARSRRFFTGVMGLLLRPFWSKAMREMVGSFLLPVMGVFIQGRKEGKDWLFYDAPLVLYFHASAYADPFDSVVAATYAVLAAESLGLGSCFIGTPSHFLKRDRTLLAKYAIPATNQHGIAVAMGHPKLRYARALKRRLASLRRFGAGE